MEPRKADITMMPDGRKVDRETASQARANREIKELSDASQGEDSEEAQTTQDIKELSEAEKGDDAEPPKEHKKRKAYTA